MHKLGFTLQIYHQLLHSDCTQGAVSIAKHLKQIPLLSPSQLLRASSPLLCYWNPNQLKRSPTLNAAMHESKDLVNLKSSCSTAVRGCKG